MFHELSKQLEFRGNSVLDSNCHKNFTHINKNKYVYLLFKISLQYVKIVYELLVFKCFVVCVLIGIDCSNMSSIGEALVRTECEASIIGRVRKSSS